MDRSQRGPRNLVPTIAEKLRDRVFRGAPDDRLGSLPDLASELGVGIVTIQQAARILEHEGLLEVRRGPGGGYYGRRPDKAALERAFSAYMRTHPDSFDEALDITSLLFVELCGAAARCRDSALREELRRLHARLDHRDAGDEIGLVEAQLQTILFRMVDRPILELLTRVMLSFAARRGEQRLDHAGDRSAGWLAGRQRIIAAIVAGDGALARFEAERSNRQPIMAALEAVGLAGR
jgi:DNA-binding FadR family transcriptional regulator